ncbi:MAG: inositol monophosphatase family protein, partial [Pseudomonadota bacterium]
FEAVATGAEHVWILDPIDGTRAFICGLPTWGTLIGLKSNGHAQLGMMTQPFTGERYFGDGRTAQYNGPGGPAALKTRTCARIEDATLFCTTPQMFSPVRLEKFRTVEDRVRLSRYGIDCYAYVMLARGLVDLVIEDDLKPYDIAALIPIIEGAGGRVTTWSGDNAVDGGSILASGDPDLHEAVLDLLAL